MKFIYSLILLITTFYVNAQINPLRVNPNINLTKDSIESKMLITAINNFLYAAQNDNNENKYILDKDKIETFILLDEIGGIEKSVKYKDEHFYKPYLTNLLDLKDSTYLIDISYIGTHDSISLLRASFKFIALKRNNSFTFTSLLTKNSENWKIKKIGNTIFHFKKTLNSATVKSYKNIVSKFDKKLYINNKITEYYCCNDLLEVQKLIGVEYKSDYNGTLESVWSSTLGDHKLILLGNKNVQFDNFDSHDLWHSRLSLIISRWKVNKPVDEGCAYLYGGSWGISWKEIFKEFKVKIATNKNINWLEIKETPIYFKTKEFNNSVDDIVNALLVQKIEKENGFKGVWELLNVGPVEKGNEKYYQTLEKLTGINKVNYNEKIWELIKNEK